MASIVEQRMPSHPRPAAPVARQAGRCAVAGSSVAVIAARTIGVSRVAARTKIGVVRGADVRGIPDGRVAHGNGLDSAVSAMRTESSRSPRNRRAVTQFEET